MRIITVKGLLVGAEYDDELFENDVAKGLMCPSSKVLREIEDANGEDLELHIDSEGGDCLSWNSVCNALMSYPGEVKIVAGSTIFSEAANLVLTCGRPITAHANTIFLWHSAWTTPGESGPGALRAEADILERLNRPVKDALIRHGIPAERVEAGFSDGGALVLSASEAKEYGIVDEVIGDASDIKLSAALASPFVALAEANRRISALCLSMSKMDKNQSKSECEEPRKEEEALEVIVETEEKKPEEETTEETTETTETTETEEQPAEETEETEEKTEEVVEEEEEKEEEKKEEEEEIDLAAVVTESISKLNDTLAALTSRLDTIEQRLGDETAKLKAEAADAKQALKTERTKRLGAIAAVVSASAASDEPKDWPEAVKKCNGDKLAAFKKYGDLCRAWTKTN